MFWSDLINPIIAFLGGLQNAFRQYIVNKWLLHEYKLHYESRGLILKGKGY